MLPVYKTYRQSKVTIICCRFMQVVFGYDFGYFEYNSSKIKYIVRSVCVLQSLTLNSFLLSNMFLTMNTTDAIWFGNLIVKNFIFVFIFALVPSHSTLREFQFKLSDIDLALKTDRTRNSDQRRFIFTLSLLMIFRFVAVSCFIFKYDIHFQPVWIVFLYFPMVLALESVTVVNLLMFYSIYRRVVIFKKEVQLVNVKNIRHYRFLYKLIADVCEQYKIIFDPIFLVSLSLNIPRIVSTIYAIMCGFLSDQARPVSAISTTTAHFGTITPFITILITLSPALSAGKLAGEVQKLKLVLHDKHLFEKDNSQCREIEGFIRYVEARPLKFSVYELIPLDASLLGMVFTFCVTYLIVIAQFTHMY